MQDIVGHIVGYDWQETGSNLQCRSFLRSGIRYRRSNLRYRYDIVGNIIHTIGKKRSKTYDIVGFTYDIAGFFQYRRF